MTISLVAPIYGVENYIEKFAESVLGQTYPHIQFIFVNDGTKDASIQVLNSVIDNGYAHLRDRIILVNKKNAGLPAARKTGMEYVTGDYVWHVDPDDWLEPGAVQTIIDFAKASNYPDLIYFDLYKEYPDKAKQKKQKDFTAEQKDVYIRSMYNHHSYGCVWNKCVNKLLFKDEVRLVGKALGLPDNMVFRQPFPGPGLGVRCLGAITRDRLEALREADAILREEFEICGLAGKVWQYFIAVPDMKSVGVKNDKRYEGWPAIIRAVNTVDAMTATIEEIPYAILHKITDRITKEVEGINRVLLDLTPKPIGTIEWE